MYHWMELCAMLTSRVEHFDELVCYLSCWQCLGRNLTDHWEILLPGSHSRRTTDACAHVDNALHPVETIHSSRANIGEQFGYSLGVCISLGLVHQQPRHGYARTRAEIARRLI